jgi:hypothetical protein
MADRSDAEYLAYVHGRTPALRRVAHLLCGDPHSADDLVQETITKLYARWPRLDGVDNLDAYVHTMLVRTFLDERRRGWWRVSLFGTAPERPEAGAGGAVLGTIARSVSTGNDPTGYLWGPDGTGSFLPLPVVDGRRAAYFWPESIRNGWVVGRAGSRRTGGRSATPAH